MLELLKAAVQDGFGAVLKIDSKNVSALLGLGDAHLAAAKLLISSGAETTARKHSEESVKSYALAVKLLKEGECQELLFFICRYCDFNNGGSVQILLDDEIGNRIVISSLSEVSCQTSSVVRLLQTQEVK